MIVRSVRHRGLRQLLERDSHRLLKQDLADRVRNVMTALVLAEDMEGFVREAPPGWRVHRLSGDRQGGMERVGIGELANHLRGTRRRNCASEPGGLPLMSTGGIKVGMTPSHPGALRPA